MSTTVPPVGRATLTRDQNTDLRAESILSVCDSKWIISVAWVREGSSATHQQSSRVIILTRSNCQTIGRISLGTPDHASRRSSPMASMSAVRPRADMQADLPSSTPPISSRPLRTFANLSLLRSVRTLRDLPNPSVRPGVLGVEVKGPGVA